MWPGYNKIVKLTASDDVDFTARMTNVPARQRITKAWFTIKTTPADSDLQALYGPSVITLIPDPVTGSVIVADGSAQVVDPDFGTIPAGTAFFLWFLPRSATVGLPRGPYLPYDVQVQGSSGNEATIERGVLRIFDQITQAV